MDKELQTEILKGINFLKTIFAIAFWAYVVISVFPFLAGLVYMLSQSLLFQKILVGIGVIIAFSVGTAIYVYIGTLIPEKYKKLIGLVVTIALGLLILSPFLVVIWLITFQSGAYVCGLLALLAVILPIGYITWRVIKDNNYIEFKPKEYRPRSSF